MLKRAAQLGAVALALLSLATVGAWLRSLSSLDVVTRGRARIVASTLHERVWVLASHDGRLQLKVQRHEAPALLFGDPSQHNRTIWRWHTLPATGRSWTGSFGPSVSGRLGFGYAETRQTAGPGRRFSERVVAVPYWALVVALALPTGFIVRPVLRARRTRDRMRAGRCLDCGYDLRGSPGACPECGGLSLPGRVATP